ncbi:MAG: hypothetical protein ACOWWH_00875 [Eubacteriaceae bacterium]
MNINLKPQLITEIDLFCYMVERGKPTALITIKDQYINDAIDYVKLNYKLETYVCDLADGWKQLWIYKRDYFIEIINCLPEMPKTIYDHWVLGKVFGYSDEAIEEFLHDVKIKKF